MRKTVKCAAVNCPNRTDRANNSKEITWHGFPNDPIILAEWVSALNRKNWQPTSQSIICSEHFKPEDFNNTTSNVCINSNAVPSIFSYRQPAHKRKADGEIEPSPTISKFTDSTQKQKVLPVCESFSKDSLELEAYSEELSPAQLKYRNRYVKELEELNEKIQKLCNQPNVEVIFEDEITASDFIHNHSRNRKRKRSVSSDADTENDPLQLNGNSPSDSRMAPKSNSVVDTTALWNLRRRGRNPDVLKNSTPIVINDDIEDNEKLYPSPLGIVVKPHLRVKKFTEHDRMRLDTRFTTILSYAPKDFIEWLFKYGLLKSYQRCIWHPLSEMKLVHSDVTRFPHSGGYMWIADCCPDEIESVFNGSLFESSPYAPREILKLIYHWCCQTNFKDMVQLVKVDNPYMTLVHSWLRAICTNAIQTHVGLFGGPGKQVEVGVVRLMGAQISNSDKQMKVKVIGLLETKTKQIRLRVLESKSNSCKNLEFLSNWIHSKSVIAIDSAVDKKYLIKFGFTNIRQSTSVNQSIMKYLREIVLTMINNTISLLTINVLQQFLDELVWRERYSPTPEDGFNNIILHISQQTQIDGSIINRLSEISTNPFQV